METRTPLLEVKNLKQYFKITRKYTTKAVDGISFTIYPGETYGLVGESGSGKSTTGRSIIRLYDPTDGEVIFDGKKISGKLSKEEEVYLRTNMFIYCCIIFKISEKLFESTIPTISSLCGVSVL